MTTAFRADASNDMGIGHIMRCLTVAERLRARGVAVRFVCGDHPGSMAEILRQRAIETTLLPRSGVPVEAAEPEYGAWLGTTQSKDAEQTIGALDGGHLDWLVVDHYALDAVWESKLRAHADHLLVIDDLANRRHDCDLLVDQNFSSSGQDRYLGLVPDGTESLLGPHFAMLRPEYRQARRGSTPGNGEVRNVFIFFLRCDERLATCFCIDDPEVRLTRRNVLIG